MTPTTYSPDGLLARFRGWTAPELPAARAALAQELAALRAGEPVWPAWAKTDWARRARDTRERAA